MKQDSFNQTAYRILLLLLGLAETPLTFEEINSRFKANPRIGKKISQDTLWLYLNTLKSIGCKISRPTRKNGFQYRLLYHPFNYFVTPSDLQILKETLSQVEENISYWDIIHFCQWLQRAFGHASNKNREDLASQFFAACRLMDFNQVEELVQDLEQWCQEHHLLNVQYDSFMNGMEDIEILPQKISYQRGILYLIGHRPKQENGTLLRLDKIKSVVPFSNPSLREHLLQQQLQSETFLIRILNCSMKEYETIYENETLLQDPDFDQHLLVQIKTDNDFLLKQKLLTSGYQFQVLSPQTFKKELQNSLHQMRQLYL